MGLKARNNQSSKGENLQRFKKLSNLKKGDQGERRVSGFSKQGL